MSGRTYSPATNTGGRNRSLHHCHQRLVTRMQTTKNNKKGNLTLNQVTLDSLAMEIAMDTDVPPAQLDALLKEHLKKKMVKYR